MPIRDDLADRRSPQTYFARCDHAIVDLPLNGVRGGHWGRDPGSTFHNVFECAYHIGTTGNNQIMSSVAGIVLQQTYHAKSFTVSMGRIQGLSATLVSSHLTGSRNKHFFSPLDGC